MQAMRRDAKKTQTKKQDVKEFLNKSQAWSDTLLTLRSRWRGSMKRIEPETKKKHLVFTYSLHAAISECDGEEVAWPHGAYAERAVRRREGE